jgi:membrane-associated protein
VWGGFLVGNIPLVKDNFGLVTITIIVVSMAPMLVMFLKKEPKQPA